MEKIFIRDNNSKALISTDSASFTAYKAQRDKALKLNTLSHEVQELKQDINIIKELLTKLVDRK